MYFYLSLLMSKMHRGKTCTFVINHILRLMLYCNIMNLKCTEGQFNNKQHLNWQHMNTHEFNNKEYMYTSYQEVSMSVSRLPCSSSLEGVEEAGSISEGAETWVCWAMTMWRRSGQVWGWLLIRNLHRRWLNDFTANVCSSAITSKYFQTFLKLIRILPPHWHTNGERVFRLCICWIGRG